MEEQALSAFVANLSSPLFGPQLSDQATREKIIAEFAAYEKIELPAIGAGPADDAERVGLPIRIDGETAIIPLTGPMMKRSSFFMRMIFGSLGTAAVARAIKAAAADERIENIVLVVDSPGGTVDGLSEIGDAIQAAAAEKEVIAQIDGICASAAYYAASQASRIFAGRTDMIGSIGVKLWLLDSSKAFEMEGFKAIAIDTGTFKSAGDTGLEITEEHQAYFQNLVDRFFDDFVAMVSAGRNMSDADVRRVGDGRMFIAEEALKEGLIDGIQALDETMTGLRGQRAKQSRRPTGTARARLALNSRLHRAAPPLSEKEGTVNDT